MEVVYMVSLRASSLGLQRPLPSKPFCRPYGGADKQSYMRGLYFTESNLKVNSKFDEMLTNRRILVDLSEF
jgi:hypothetical protein